MDTFGSRLMTEREERGLTIPSVAQALGVEVATLVALERDDYRALPEQPVVMRCLKGYARYLDVDAELMIEDYERERERHLGRRAGRPSEPTVELTSDDVVSPGREAPAAGSATSEPGRSSSPAMETPLETRPRGLPRFATGLVAAVIVALGGAWWLLSGDDSPARPDVVSASPSLESVPPGAAPAAAGPAEPVAPAARPEPVKPLHDPPRSRSASPQAEATLAVADPVAATPATSLGIEEFGVGTAIRDRSLVGEGTRFTQGSKVWFWTRVEGGQAGDRIEHVWLEGGVEKLRIALEIGGSPWRTYSSKTLHPGSSGRWAVEARDGQGRVLARSEFLAAP